MTQENFFQANVTPDNPEEIRRSLDERQTDVDQPIATTVPTNSQPQVTAKVDRSQMSNEWRARNPE